YSNHLNAIGSNTNEKRIGTKVNYLTNNYRKFGADKNGMYSNHLNAIGSNTNEKRIGTKVNYLTNNYRKFGA
ncbi:hypothetical protein R3X41_25420, partial [Salmonella enterica subsp. enterica serovar Agona]|nr:hypothetical protein [Salmonella enterica subsp. enterica serovar Agona]